MNKKRAPNLTNTPITREKWDKMLAAYRKRPTITYLVEVADVGRRTARRAVMEGWPDYSLPPFIELLSSGTTVHKEMAITRESWEEAAITKGEAARVAAEEAMAARTVMASAVKAVQIAEKLAAALLRRLEQDPDAMLPEELGPKEIKQIVEAIQKSSAAVEAALRIERMRAGEPEALLGIQIGMMLERCSEEELEDVIDSGHLPNRLVNQRRLTMEQLEGSGDRSKEEIDTTPGNEGFTIRETEAINAQDTDSFMEDMRKHLGFPNPKKHKEVNSSAISIDANVINANAYIDSDEIDETDEDAEDDADAERNY